MSILSELRDLNLKRKYPRSEALQVARILNASLEPYCERIVFAGSLRRRKSEVGDIEVIYIPKFGTEPDDLFDTKQVNLADRAIDQMLASSILSKRLNSESQETWGEKNKLATHVATGIPVDLFQATTENWFNYLTFRTGSAENNTRIAGAALRKGWRWNPYSAGFTDEYGNLVRVETEQDVFRLVGLPYLEPWQR